MLILSPVRLPYLLALAGIVLMLGDAALVAIKKYRHQLKRTYGARLRIEQLSAERLTLALEGEDLALWDLDVPQFRATFNDRWFTMLGLQPQAELQDPSVWRDRVHPDEIEAVETALADHMEGRSPRCHLPRRQPSRQARLPVRHQLRS